MQRLVQRVPRFAGHGGGGAGRVRSCCYKGGFDVGIVAAVVVVVVQGIRRCSVAGSIRLRAR
jgi:hypothetical protein